MFEGEEHRSYVALMRELRLEWEYDEGDWFFVRGRPRVWGHRPHSGELWPNSFPLPRLDQWLTKIRECGGLRNIRLYYPMTIEDDFVAKAYFADDRTVEGRAHDSVEEAGARLWMTVTGREAPRA